MTKTIQLQTPLTDKILNNLKIGDTVLLSGIIYTARDVAHKRMHELFVHGKDLPIDVKGQIIYYVGPTPPKPGKAIGSAGPSTSYRMDIYTPELIKLGLKGMIGKGPRSGDVTDAIKKYKAIYFGATGGAGALISKVIKKSEIVAYEDLGAEAIFRLEVENFPLIVINDVHGNDLYKEGVKKYS